LDENDMDVREEEAKKVVRFETKVHKSDGVNWGRTVYATFTYNASTL
jgi:hypothetical protein